MYKKVLTLVLAGLLVFSVPTFAAPSAWAETEVKMAEGNGLVPDRIRKDYQTAITREEFCEMALMFWSKLTKQEMPVVTSTFLDTQNPAVAAAQSLGIVQGESPTQFSPQKSITRQEICVMLQNALRCANPNLRFPEAFANTFPDGASIADWAMEAVQCMNLFAVMLGDENNCINPLGNTTREQAILLTFRLWTTQVMTQQEYVEKVLLPVNGNTHDNMLNGAYVVGTGGGNIYYAGPNGIWKVGSETPIVAKPAKSFLLYSENLYYVGADANLYMVKIATGEEKLIATGPVDQMSSYNGALYYCSRGGIVYRMALDTMEAVPFTPAPGELPIVSGKHVYYSDGNGIYMHNADGSFTQVFSGVNKNLCVRNDKFYFLNEENVLSTADLSGANYRTISRLPITSYCFTRECIIAIGSGDNGVYKLDYDGRYTIKMDTGTYVNINTYDDYVYARDAQGGIYAFTNYGTEKEKIN